MTAAVTKISVLLTDTEQLILTKNKHGDTVLHVAAELGSAAAMRYLLSELPLDLVSKLMKARGFYDRTPLMKAVANERDYDVSKLLMRFMRSEFSYSGNNTV